MQNNTKEMFGDIYCVMILVTLESTSEDVLSEMVHFCIEVQVSSFKEIC